MLSRLREHFGSAGLVVAVIALVAALGGGAIAATGGAGNGKATASAKAKKGPRGPKGPKGNTGPAGPAGPQGAAGAKGDTGAPGTTGAAGTSVASSESNTTIDGTHCTGVGGSKFVAGASTTYACNGKAGKNGEIGDQGPPGPTCDEVTGECLLPEGATETGIWAIHDKQISGIYLTLSFPLRLPEGASPEFHYVTAEEWSTETAPPGCPGNSGEPAANPEQFCMYEAFKSNLGPPGALFLTTDIRSGRAMEFPLVNEAEMGEATGSWAVTSL